MIVLGDFGCCLPKNAIDLDMYETALNADSIVDFAGPMKPKAIVLFLPPPEVQKFGSNRPSCTSLTDFFSHGYERSHAQEGPWVGAGH